MHTDEPVILVVQQSSLPKFIPPVHIAIAMRYTRKQGVARFSLKAFLALPVFYMLQFNKMNLKFLCGGFGFLRCCQKLTDQIVNIWVVGHVQMVHAAENKS